MKAVSLLGVCLGACLASDTVELQLLPSSLARGGRCQDGTMAGYYWRKGTDPSLFVIHLEGGGGCIDKDSCTERATTEYGSSSSWEKTVKSQLTFSSDCDKKFIFS